MLGLSSIPLYFSAMSIQSRGAHIIRLGGRGMGSPCQADQSSRTTSVLDTDVDITAIYFQMYYFHISLLATLCFKFAVTNFHHLPK